MHKYARIFAVAVLCLTLTSAAEAAATRFGATVAVVAALARGNVVAYDSTNKVYLVVSSHGVVWGRFVDSRGNPVGGAFQVQGNPAAFGHFPRAAFSPDADGGAGGFLVTWHEGAPSVHGRMVSYGKGGAYGADSQLTTDVSWWEAGAPVAYSTISREFLVAWRSMPVKGGAPFNDIHAVRVDNNATAMGPVFAVTNDVPYNDNPSIAFNSATNEFLVVYAGYNDAGGFAFADAQRVQPGTGALIGAATRLVVTGGVYITDVTFNTATQKYLASWYSLPTGAVLARNLNNDGTLNGDIIMLSNRWKAYDALSVAYNPIAGTFFMVSHGTTAEDGGVELSAGGTPVDNGFAVTASGGSGNFYPRIAASTTEPNWLLSTSRDFSATMAQLLAGSGSGTPAPAPQPSPQPAPPATVSTPLMSIDVPGNGTTVSSRGFQVAGWAIDRGSSSGPGIDAIHVYAWPVSGAAPIFIGAANYGIARPDVAGAFGGSQFTASGFSILATGIPPGTYDLAVYARSTLSGKFDGRVSRINVAAPPSNPRMYIDLPSQNSTQSQNVVIAGWALDLASDSGSGVDAIHVYAYKAGVSTPIWLGAASTGGGRPDVAGAFGSSKFTPCGYMLTTTMSPGDYTIVVFAHSSVTGTFNNAATADVHIR
jgi:hypothetical protein